MAHGYDESITMMSGEENNSAESQSSFSDEDEDDLQNETFQMSPRPRLFQPPTQHLPQNLNNRPQTPSHNNRMTGGIPRPTSAAINRQPATPPLPPLPGRSGGGNRLNNDADQRFLTQEIKKMHLQAQQFLNDNDDDEHDSLNDDTNLSSFLGEEDDEDDDADLAFLYPTHPDEDDDQDYGSWIDAAVEGVASPFHAFPHNPPIHDETAMKEYFKLRDIWELQLNIKRDRLGDFVSKNCMQPGIHKSGVQVPYNPEDYSNLEVPLEVSQLFSYIQPPRAEIKPEVKLGPYIPDYYPSVGDVDAFIKVEEGSLDESGIGLGSLDEPTMIQSDPAFLGLQLRSWAKIRSAMAVRVRSLEDPGSHPELVDKWIKDITELHRSKPSPAVHYGKPMPELDTLLQEWPPEVEQVIKEGKLPELDLQADLGTWVDVVCGLLDIPVHKGRRIQSLHVLFSLYAASREFNGVVGGGGMDSYDLERDRGDGVRNSASGGSPNKLMKVGEEEDEMDSLKII